MRCICLWPAVKVGDASSEFAKAAETESARFLLLKGAVNFYTRYAEALAVSGDAILRYIREARHNESESENLFLREDEKLMAFLDAI